jgi:hypothetical protein
LRFALPEYWFRTGSFCLGRCGMDRILRCLPASFSPTRIAAFFGLDVFVSAIVLFVFSRVEGARLGIRMRWLVVVAVLTVGVSLGLPLVLYLRELALEGRTVAEG